MTDIVERLCSRSPYLKDSAAERDMEEAAAEIKLLRANNERLRTVLRWLNGLGADAHEVIRRALEPKP